MVNIIKKNGDIQKFNGEKIKRAIRKSASRVCVTLSDKEEKQVVDSVKKQLQFQETDIKVDTIHNMVEVALDHVNSDVARSYREYRDNKNQFASMLDKVYSKKLSLNFIGDRSNANSDSALVTTQKAIVYNELNSELYKKFFLTQKEERAVSDGYIYIHDRGSRLDTINCCIYDMKNLITGGFFMGNLDYQEPKSLEVAFDLIGDVTLNAASSQYGGFTIPQVDKLFAPYAEKSYKKYYNEFLEIACEAEDSVDKICSEKDYTLITRWTDGLAEGEFDHVGDYGICKKESENFNNLNESIDEFYRKADDYATNKVRRDFEQGFQSWEMKFNSVASSRGDYPFTAITFGLGTGKFETMCSSICMKVRAGGQGNEGHKHPVLFPKLSFFYDENLHGEGKKLEWLFDEALNCSMKTMYPDFISLTGDGYAPRMYKKYGVAISRMGCIDYSEKLTISDRNFGYSPRELMIGEFFKSLKDGKGFNYTSSRVKRISKKIRDENDRKKFEERGYIWYDGELMNQWAKDFKEYYGRRPTRGDVKEYFGYDLHRKSIRNSRGIDSSLFNLWDSYLELKVVDLLKNNKFIEVNTIQECVSDMMFVRNKMLRNGDGIAKQIDIYFPTRKMGIEVQDFATHSHVDNEEYTINGSHMEGRAFKKGPSYSRSKETFFKNLGVTITEIWEDSIRKNDYSTLSDVLGIELNSVDHERTEIVKTIDTDDVEMIDLDGIGIKRYVKDIDGSWVQVHKIIKNKNVTDWVLITFATGKTVLVTSDHPFITESGQLIASELCVGQNLIDDNDELIRIVSIEHINRTANSYDIETSSGTFVFSGIQSHNCRAQTSPWFERGGMEPADENDKPIYDGRFNMGAISLHFSMIAAKAKKEDKDFFEVLEYYLDMVRGIHKRTVEFLSHKKAGINPLGFCQGGFYHGNKNPDEELGLDFLKPMTISFGIIGLNEASVFETGKPIHEDNSWAIKVLKFINDYADKYKKIDGILYAIYGTPGESLCSTQSTQMKKKYGIIKGVSDKDYVTNSFHCHVSADITPIQKQDIEYPMFHLCNGGNIGYARMRSNYNFKAFKDITKRAMKMGFYWGNNQQLDWCEDCGFAFSDSDTCPKCGSEHITRIERMNGYLSYASIRGKTMYSDAKLTEFKDRKSM